MKIHKTKNKKSLFLHIIEPSISIDGFEFYDAKKIKKIKKDSIEKIYVGDLFDYLLDDEILQYCDEIILKLSKNGKLIIQATDPKCLASSLLYSNMHTGIYKNILYGFGKKNIHSLGEIKKLVLSSNQMKIDECRFINEIQYYLECSKNE